jgi:uncharacterized protein
MDAEALSKQKGAFYAPAFRVDVDGKALMQQRAIGVSGVDVELGLNAMGRFSFTVVNTYRQHREEFLSAFDERVLDILKFGASVEVAVGYGDLANLTVIIAGMVTEISTNFPEGGAPELTVAGYDHLFPLTLGKTSKSWKESKDSDVVTKLARKHGLGTSKIRSTEGNHKQIEQNQESDFDFLKKLAGRNHFEFYVDIHKDLHFGKPSDKRDGLITLRWGESLLSFKPEANLASQVSRVEIYGWDADNKKAFVGRADAGEESGHDPRRRSGGEELRSVLGSKEGPVLEIRQPVFTQAEAKGRARAALNDRAKQFLTGEFECIGLPELLPDVNVILGNLGRPFSKTYYIQQTSHKVDGSGYRTRAKVKETTLWK